MTRNGMDWNGERRRPWYEAFETFRRMEMDGIEPSVVTYGALMDALSRRVLELTSGGGGGGRAGGGVGGGGGSVGGAAAAGAGVGARAGGAAGAAGVGGGGQGRGRGEVSAETAEEVGRLLERCFDLREEMDDNGMKADPTLLNSLVSACGRAAAIKSLSADALAKAFDVYHQMEDSRLQCDAYTYASLIKARGGGWKKREHPSTHSFTRSFIRRSMSKEEALD